MAAIHFAVLYGVDYELDLFPWWIEHYRNMRFDSYKVFLHREEGNIPDYVIDLFRKEGYETLHCSTGREAVAALSQQESTPRPAPAAGCPTECPGGSRLRPAGSSPDMLAASSLPPSHRAQAER